MSDGAQGNEWTCSLVGWPAYPRVWTDMDARGTTQGEAVHRCRAQCKAGSRAADRLRRPWRSNRCFSLSTRCARLQHLLAFRSDRGRAVEAPAPIAGEPSAWRNVNPQLFSRSSWTSCRLTCDKYIVLQHRHPGARRLNGRRVFCVIPRRRAPVDRQACQTVATVAGFLSAPKEVTRNRETE